MVRDFLLKWPSFGEFKKKVKACEDWLSEKEIKSVEGFKKFQKRHPIANVIIKGLAESAGPPISDIINKTFEEFSPDKKAEGELEVFSLIKSFGEINEDHYKLISNKLESIEINMAKEGTALKMKEILLASDKKLDVLVNDLIQINSKLDSIEKKHDQTDKKIDIFSDESNQQHKEVMDRMDEIQSWCDRW